MDDPLKLTQLADVDHPEVVRGALRRFRKRVLVWTVWVVGAAIVLPLVLSRTRPADLPYLVRHAKGVEIGATIEHPFVRALILDVRRPEPKMVVVHAILSSDAMRPGENLHIDIGFGGGNIETARLYNGGKRFAEERGAGSLIEAWFAVLPGTRTFDFDVISASGDTFDGSTASRAQPPADPGKLARRPEVIQDRFTIDFGTLGVPDAIWR